MKHPFSSQWLLDSNGETLIGTTETTILEKTSEVAIKGYIFTSNMQTGDTFIITVYIKDSPSGVYRKTADEPITGAQVVNAKPIGDQMGEWGIKVTIKKDAGTDRNFKWVFWKDR